jgi:hypothetical protein
VKNGDSDDDCWKKEKKKARPRLCARLISVFFSARRGRGVFFSAFGLIPSCNREWRVLAFRVKTGIGDEGWRQRRWGSAGLTDPISRALKDTAEGGRRGAARGWFRRLARSRNYQESLSSEADKTLQHNTDLQYVYSHDQERNV